MEDNYKILRTLLEALPEKAWIATPSGEFVFFNRAYYLYTGLDEKEALLQGWDAVLPEDELPEIKKKWENVLKRGFVFKKMLNLKQAHKSKYRLHISKAFPLKKSDNQIFAWIGIFTDIHAYKLAVHKIGIFKNNLHAKRQALIKTQTHLDNFIYVASHNLKAPIANIQGLMTLLKNSQETGFAEKQQHILSMIDLSVTKLSDTLAELTRITQVHQKQAGTKEYIYFSEAVKQLLREVEPQFPQALPIKVSFDFQVPGMYYQKTDLYTIIRHLLTNAFKFRSPVRTLSIKFTTCTQEKYTLFTMTDNGLGINPGQHKKIFQMFKKLHAHDNGAGNGLYISRELVEKHEGKMDFQSEEDKGTTFRIFFDNFFISHK